MNSDDHAESTPFALTCLVALWAIGLLWSGWKPHDRITWLMEVFPCFIALAFMWPTRKSFELTPLVYWLVTVHGLILMLGGAYTYAHVPLGFWMQDWFGFARNNYDKIGHFAQGFVPAIVARELLMRKFAITRHGLVAFLCIAICLGFSAFYELIEWWSALIMGQGAEEFLGTQGDPWDTQSDMFFALIGASCALLALSRWHDIQMNQIASGSVTTSS
jgi:putative membrane protein